MIGTYAQFAILGIDPRSIALALIAVANLILGVSIYLSSPKRSSRFFFFTVMGVVAWATGINFYIQPGISLWTEYFSMFNYVAAALISVCFFFFAYLFEQDDRVIPKWLLRLTSINLALVVLFIISPGLSKRLIVETITEEGGAKIETFGALYPLYVVFIAGYFFTGLGLLVSKFRKSAGTVKKRLFYIIFGTGLSIVFGITTNIALPNFGYSNYDWLGPFGTFGMIAFIFTAVRRHGLFDFKLIAIEVLIGLMSMTLIIQIMVSDSLYSRIVQSVIFAITLIFSYFLIKGLMQGVVRREKMQQLTEGLKLANQKLKEMDAEKSDFVSITSHQFRTPLTVIKGYASMLLEGSFGSVTNPAQYKVLETIFRASQRLVLLIEEFLSISRIEKGEMQYTFAPIDLRRLVSDIINQFKIAIKGEKIHFTFNAELGETYTIRADAAKIQQVLRNILDNAIKYSREEGSVTVTLSKRKNEGIVRVAVTDSGIGLQPEIMQRLFEKFSRARSVSKLHTEGRGLGLYVARQVMSAHGGKIWAESAGRGKGSTFYLDFQDPERERGRREIKSFIEDL